MNICLFLKMLITLLIMLTEHNTVLVSMDVYTGKKKGKVVPVLD
jgi:hypothetical protein